MKSDNGRAEGRWLTVEEIVFFDGSVLKNREVIFFKNFIIVKGIGGKEPSLYNTRGVEILRGVGKATGGRCVLW